MREFFLETYIIIVLSQILQASAKINKYIFILSVSLVLKLMYWNLFTNPMTENVLSILRLALILFSYISPQKYRINLQLTGFYLKR